MTSEHYRALLFSIAYRMTGSASDAEDLVQETYLRYQSSEREKIVSLKAYLTTMLTHLVLDYLKSARVAREQYLGTWLPEPILTSEDSGPPLANLEQQEALSLGRGCKFHHSAAQRNKGNDTISIRKMRKRSRWQTFRRSVLGGRGVIAHPR